MATASGTDIKSGEENIAFLPQVRALDVSLSSSVASASLLKSSLTGGAAQPASAPNITAPSYVLDYNLGSLEIDDFKDRGAYPQSQFTEETQALEQLNDLLTKGEEFITMLYTYRSCSRAMPMITLSDTDEATKLDIHKKTFNILRPQILRLNAFMDFQEKAVALVRASVLLVQKADAAKLVQSEPLLSRIVDAIDMLVLLDALKDMRAALQNDFSRYKRAFAPIRGELADSDALNDEIHTLQMFLSNPQQAHNLILSHLKTDIHKVQGHEIVLSLLIGHCCDAIENGVYLLPRQLHAYYRVLLHLLYLVDSDDKQSSKATNVFKLGSSDKFKFSLSRVQKLFKAFPIIPLYADMHLDVLFVLRRCAHWDEQYMLDQWVTKQPQKIKERYELLYHRQKIRSDYTEFTARFTALLNEINAFTAAKRIVTPKMLQSVFATVLEGLKLLSAWAAKVAEQSAYKYSRPKTDAEYKALGGRAQQAGGVDPATGKPLPSAAGGMMGTGDNTAFEKAVKFNYSNEELYALVDVIGMIKGLGGLMLDSQLIHSPLVRRHIHDDTQIFLQQELARPLRKAFKKNKKIKDVMLQMRDIGCDWVDRSKQMNDYQDKKEVLLQVNRDFPRRAVAPSLTQMHLLRRMMHTIFSPDAPGMQGGIFAAEKDLKKEWLPVWEDFYRDSFYFPYMLDFPSVLRELTDLSSLWYREFYLEVTKCVQFPISQSMPWILTEFLIANPAMKENIFFPMDIYNDAAAHALYNLKQQFLYDEIEAELNLSFEQLLYALAEDIFKYFKTVASGILVNKSYDAKFWQIPNAPGAKGARLSFVESRYQSLMAQRNIPLLGRHVDLNALLSVSINEYLRKNLDYILRRFESADLCRGLIDLKFLVENVRCMHALLADHLTLDPWELMWKEVNDDANLGQKRGRVVSHIFTELVQDILPAFVFSQATSRWVRSMPELVSQPDRARFPTAAQSWFWFGRKYEPLFAKYTQLYHGFFGTEHLEAMLSVLSAGEIPLLLNELTSEVENKILYDFHPYFRALIEALPPMKLPKLAYGVVGGHGFFEVKLKNSIGGYAPLRPAVFQMLREIGNAVLFVRQLEGVQKTSASFAFMQHAHWSGIKAHPVRAPNAPLPTSAPATAFVAPPAGSVPPLLQALRDGFGAYSSVAAGYARPLQQSVVDESLKIASDSLSNLYNYEEGSSGASVLTGMLTRLRHQIQASVGQDWNGAADSVANPLEVEQPKNLSRLLNCLQFLYCTPPQFAESPNDLSTFGESWSWGVCTLVHLASQRRKFELLDLGAHVLRLDTLSPIDRERLEGVFHSSSKKVKPSDQDLNERTILEFLRLVERVKLRNDAIFDALSSYLPPQPPSRFVVPLFDESEAAAAAAAAVPHGAIHIQPKAASEPSHTRADSHIPAQAVAPPPPRQATPESAAIEEANEDEAAAGDSNSDVPPVPASVSIPPPSAPAPPPAGPPPPSAPAPPPAGPPAPPRRESINMPPPFAPAQVPPPSPAGPSAPQPPPPGPPPHRASISGPAPPPAPPGHRASISGPAPPPVPPAHRSSISMPPPPAASIVPPPAPPAHRASVSGGPPTPQPPPAFAPPPPGPPPPAFAPPPPGPPAPLPPPPAALPAGMPAPPPPMPPPGHRASISMPAPPPPMPAPPAGLPPPPAGLPPPPAGMPPPPAALPPPPAGLPPPPAGLPPPPAGLPPPPAGMPPPPPALPPPPPALPPPPPALPPPPAGLPPPPPALPPPPPPSAFAPPSDPELPPPPC